MGKSHQLLFQRLGKLFSYHLQGVCLCMCVLGSPYKDLAVGTEWEVTDMIGRAEEWGAIQWGGNHVGQERMEM